MNWDAMIDAEARRRKALELRPEGSASDSGRSAAGGVRWRRSTSRLSTTAGVTRAQQPTDTGSATYSLTIGSFVRGSQYRSQIFLVVLYSVRWLYPALHPDLRSAADTYVLAPMYTTTAAAYLPKAVDRAGGQSSTRRHDLTGVWRLSGWRSAHHTNTRVLRRDHPRFGIDGECNCYYFNNLHPTVPYTGRCQYSCIRSEAWVEGWGWRGSHRASTRIVHGLCLQRASRSPSLSSTSRARRCGRSSCPLK